MNVKKTRRGYVLWPMMILGAVSIASACSGSGGSSSEGVNGGDSASGGSEVGTDAGTGSGATSSGGGSKATGGQASSDGGMSGGGEAAAAGNGMGGAGGAAVDLCEGLDLECEDDDNPCTEDACNPATGECGIPRSGTSCDDGLYCNGADECDAGECTAHEGNPCGDMACNEAENYCECSMDEDCPDDDPGEWGDCTYGNTCVETGTHSRPVTTWSCKVGKCVSAATVEMEDCTRDTDGIDCEDDGLKCTGAEKCKNGNCVGAGDPCKGTAKPGCFESGTLCRECSDTNTSKCTDSQYCCKGACTENNTLCGVIGTTLPPLAGSIATFANP